MSRISRKFAVLLAVVCLGFAGALNLWAQSNGDDLGPTKVDLFAGYSYMEPGGKVGGVNLKGMNKGWGVAPTFNVNKWFGLTFDAGGHYGDNADVTTISGGPKLTLHMGRVAPFAEMLLGWHRLSPGGLPDDSGLGLMTGGGFDVRVHRYLSLRLLQADYVFGKHDYPLPNSSNLNGARVQGGLVFHFGTQQPGPPPSAACSANPTEVMAGEAVRVTAVGNNFNAKHTLKYDWSSTGGKLSGTDGNGTVDTAGLAAGSYTVTANISDPKHEKDKASCSTSFSVKEPPKNPPTMSCSANPSSVRAGDPSTISCSCSSPDGRPVTISNWVASAGRVSGSGNAATLDTAGLQAGPVSVSASCSDDRGLTATGNANVNVEVPPPAPTASKINECSFPNKVKPARVDNACKAALDDVALRLQRDADAKGVIVGNQAKNEKGKTLSAQRAVNSKAYLTSGENQKAIDPSRLEVRTGSDGETKADYWIVPAGATFSEAGTSPVDEKKVKPQVAPAHHAAAATKKAAKKAAPAKK